MGGFFGPEIRFAGYDGIVITGKATELCYVVIDDGKVEIREAKKFKGMRTDAFDKAILERTWGPEIQDGLHRTGRGKSRSLFQHPSYCGRGQRAGAVSAASWVPRI